MIVQNEVNARIRWNTLTREHADVIKLRVHG
jgi:hypothetical protein